VDESRQAVLDGPQPTATSSASEAYEDNYSNVVTALVLKARRYAEVDPEIALNQARKAAEAMCRHLFALRVGKPGKIMLDQMLEKLVSAEIISTRVAVPFRTIQAYGNFSVHAQSDLQTVDANYAKPGLSALEEVNRWYFREALARAMPRELEAADSQALTPRAPDRENTVREVAFEKRELVTPPPPIASPAPLTETRARPSARAAEADLKRPPTILLVDDEPVNRDMFSRRFTRKGFVVDVAVDGHEALVKIFERPYDLVLLDVMMPGLSGLEVLREVRKSRSVAELPIIIATMLNETDLVVSALESGASDFVTKSMEFEITFARVNAQIAGKRASDRARALANQLEARNSYIREVLGRFVSHEVAETALSSPTGFTLSGEKRDVTVLVCRLAGFNMLTDSLAPEQVLKLLNNYFGAMTEIVAQFGGMLEDFGRDGLNVVFGAPTARADDPSRAVACALEMQTQIADVNEQNQSNGLPAIQAAIGISSGPAVVGNIGSRRRAKYGVIGANATIASQIVTMATGGQVLISQTTHALLGAAVKIAGQIKVALPGVHDPVVIAEVVGMNQMSQSPKDVG
jgi:adenylate cyclase